MTSDRFTKYLPIIWRTIEDALKAQEAEQAGLLVLTAADDEGYLIFVEAVDVVEFSKRRRVA